MNNFHPDNFKPDMDYDTLLPWKQDMKFLRVRKKSSEYAGKKECPKCGLSSENLVWIKYSEPNSDWAV